MRFRRDRSSAVLEDVGSAAERDSNDSDDEALESLGASVHRRAEDVLGTLHDFRRGD